MRIKKGFELTSVCGENIVLASGEANINFSKVICLNESAAYVWKSVEGKDFTESDMTKALLDEYEIDEMTAQRDVVGLVRSWIDAGLVE